MFAVTDDVWVRTLTLDNPGKRNAIPVDRWQELAQVFIDFEQSAARVLVVTGAGEDFCSGADVSSMFADRGNTTVYESMEAVGAAAGALHRTSKPTIAAVDGYAVGAGMNLALGCDIMIASERAKFAELFVSRGLTLDFGGTWLLARRVGLARAKDLALTGRMIDAAEAADMGMVSRVVPAAELAAVASEVARELASGAPLAQRFTKAGLDRSFEMSFEETLDYEQSAQTLLFSTEDVAEGMSSFLQKRPPEFKGR